MNGNPWIRSDRRGQMIADQILATVCRCNGGTLTRQLTVNGLPRDVLDSWSKSISPLARRPMEAE